MKHASRILKTPQSLMIIGAVCFCLIFINMCLAQNLRQFSNEETQYPDHLYGSEINIFGAYGIWSIDKVNAKNANAESLKERRYFEVMDEINGELVMIPTNTFIEANKMSPTEAIKKVGGIPLPLESLYVAFRMFELLPKNINSEAYATNLNNSIMALEGTMYLAAQQNEAEIYTVASGTRHCILSLLVNEKKSDVSDLCILTLRVHLYSMIDVL